MSGYRVIRWLGQGATAQIEPALESRAEHTTNPVERVNAFVLRFIQGRALRLVV
jgi:hypothetical protein